MDVKPQILSAQDAADRAGVTKQTIINKIKNKELVADRDGAGAWQVNAAVFYSVYPNASRGPVGEGANLIPPSHQNLTKLDSDLTVKLKEENAKLQAERDAAEAALKREREFITDMRNDLLKAQDRADKATAIMQALTDQRSDADRRAQEAKEKEEAAKAAMLKELGRLSEVEREFQKQRKTAQENKAKAAQNAALQRAQQAWHQLPFWKRWQTPMPTEVEAVSPSNDSQQTGVGEGADNETPPAHEKTA